MPLAPPTCCPCGGLRINGKCDRCGPRKETRSAEDQHRRNVTYGRQWKQFTACYLAEHPLCVDCEAEGHVGAATEVHHKQKVRHRPDLQYEEDNLMALCKPCHSTRTSRGE